MPGARGFVILCVIGLGICFGATAGVVGADLSGESAAQMASTQPVDPDQVFMLVTIQPDGDATWAIQYRLELSTENETAAFEELQSDIRNNRSQYIADFRPGVEATVAEAENLTGREMGIENLTVRTGTQQFGRYGVVTYSFTWQGFAAMEGETIRAGDALAGLFLDRSTTLRFEWPADYEATQVRPNAEDRGADYVLWTGERSFGSGEPRVVLKPVGATNSPVAVDPMLVGAGFVLLVLIAGGVWMWRRGVPPSGSAVEPSTDDVSEAETVAGEQAPPDELLSNEERVLRLLEANNGRIKQQRVVDELDWTAAKTSQVINGMKEEGTVEVFRLGRENVLRLPEESEEEEENA